MPTSRRNFLKTAGATLALPWLDSFNGFAHAADVETSPQRLLMICLPLGIYRNAIIPGEAGPKYKSTEYLSLICLLYTSDAADDWLVVVVWGGGGG